MQSPRGDRYQKQYDCYSHPSFILAVKGYGYELKGGAHVCRDGGLHPPSSCLLPRPFNRSRRQYMTQRTRHDRNLIGTGGVRISRWYASSLASRGVCRSLVWRVLSAMPRRPASINRHQMVCDAAQQTICADAIELCVLSRLNRAKLTSQVATGFVRRSSFSLNLVCRSRLDRDFRTWGGYA